MPRKRPLESFTKDYVSAYCKIPTPEGLIGSIEDYLSKLLDPSFFELSDKDRRKLRRVVKAGIAELDKDL
jgi:hypothetical protein